MNHMPLFISYLGFIKALTAALVGMLMVFLSAGCNGTGDDNAERSTGTAVVSVSALNAGDVVSATISITASDIPTPITAALSSSNGWQATIGAIPAGTARTAIDANGVEQYHGSATNVTVNRTWRISMSRPFAAQARTSMAASIAQ